MVSALVLLVESADRKAAFCVGLVSPFMISFITVSASLKVRSCFVTILMIASLIIVCSSLSLSGQISFLFRHAPEDLSLSDGS